MEHQSCCLLLFLELIFFLFFFPSVYGQALLRFSGLVVTVMLIKSEGRAGEGRISQITVVWENNMYASFSERQKSE